MEINVAKIEQNIYLDICQDFAEYCENRLRVYEGVTNFLKTVPLETIIQTPTPDIYEMYKNHCLTNGLNCLESRSFIKVMVTSCGFDHHRYRTKKGGKDISVHYFKLASGV